MSPGPYGGLQGPPFGDKDPGTKATKGPSANGGPHALVHALANALANGVAHDGQPPGHPPQHHAPPKAASLPPLALALQGPAYDAPHRQHASAATSPTGSDHDEDHDGDHGLGHGGNGNGVGVSPGQCSPGVHSVPSAPPSAPPGFTGPLGSPEPKPLPLPDLSPPRPRTRSVGLQVRRGFWFFNGAWALGLPRPHLSCQCPIGE